MSVDLKYQTLLTTIKKYPASAVAFSGGVDSTLLAKALYDVFGQKGLAVTVFSPLVPQWERLLAQKMAAFIGIPHRIIEIPELDADVVSNPPDRCYYCKNSIFKRIKSESEKEGISIVFDGSNTDDMDDYRPGMRALRELGIKSPLKEAGLDKESIRQISKHLKLKTWDHPSYACLASRFPYNSPITEEKLNMVEAGEDFLHTLGFRQIRLRHHDEIGRIEISRDEIDLMMDTETMDKVSMKLKELGFIYVCLELEGYKMGNLNKLLEVNND